MKLVSFFILSLISISVLTAQNISDGLRYSAEDNLGTARFTALSGAMGALGGDLSAIRSNPAGGAVFMNSMFTLTASLADLESTSTYFGNTEKSYANNANLSQAGGIFVFNNSNEESSFKKLTVGVSYDVTRNFRNEQYLAGRGNTSIGNFFLSQAQGIPVNLLELQGGESISNLYQYLGENYGSGAQNAFLGYQGYLFDPMDPDNSENSAYSSNVSGNSFGQEYLNVTKGYNSKFTVNIAAQVTNDLYFGINVNTHSIDFRQSNLFVENNNSSSSLIRGVAFENNLTVYGAGVSAQIGGIARVANNFRFGLSLDTPTWFQVSEETSQYLETKRVEDGNIKMAYIDPRILNVYEDYTLKTPGKIAASAAYIFDQYGLISFEYSYKDYSNMKFKPSNSAYFRDLNRNIDNNLKGASVLRAGAEYRLDQLSLRGGFHYEESPYKDDNLMGSLTGFSLGTGYTTGSFNLDLAYSRSAQKSQLQMYQEGFTDRAAIKNVYNNFILSLGFTL